MKEATTRVLFLEDTYHFFEVGIRIRTDSHRLLRLLKDLYPRFHSDPTGAEDELCVRLEHGTSTCRVEIRARDHHYLAFKTTAGFAFKCTDLDEGTADWLRFDQNGIQPVAPSELAPPFAGESSAADCSHLLAFVQIALLRTIALMMPHRHLLHAAALSQSGQGLLLSGDSGRGKTLLSVALMKQGFRLLSDDVACLNLDLKQLEPFPRSLNLCESATPLLTPLLGSDKVEQSEICGTVDIERLFPGSLGRRCPLRHVIILGGFREVPEIKPLAKHEALWQALKFSHSPVSNGGRTLWDLAPLFQHAHCYVLWPGNLDPTAMLLRQHLNEVGSATEIPS